MNTNLGINKDVVKSLGKRVKKSKTSNTIEIDTQDTTRDIQLDEYGNSGYIGQSKSVRAAYAEDDDRYPATECDKLLGVRQGATSAVLSPSEWHHTGSYYNETNYYDIRLLLALKNNDTDVINEYDKDEIEEAKEKYEELKVWKKPELTSNTFYAEVNWLTWSGTRNHPKATEHRVFSKVEEKGSFYYFNDEYGYPTKKKIGSNGTYVNKITDEKEIEKRLKESVEIISKTNLFEMKLSQIKQKSQNQDPARIKKSRNVKTTYIGMSKFGILNFKTTSETRSGYHYQTLEFKDMKPFNDIIQSGKEIMPLDVKAQLKNQDVNIFCTDESFTYWAWAHQAYKLDFLYIDDRIPDLKKRIQAPTVNNVRLNGGACKHILSLVDYVMRPFVLLAISDDMNRYLAAEGQDKASKQDTTTKNREDATKTWDWTQVKEYTGLSKEQILADISKTLQIQPSLNREEIIESIINEVPDIQDIGLRRTLVDVVSELIDEEEGNGNNESTD